MQTIFVKSTGEANIYLPPVIEIEPAPKTVEQIIADINRRAKEAGVSLAPADWGQVCAPT